MKFHVFSSKQSQLWNKYFVDYEIDADNLNVMRD